MQSHLLLTISSKDKLGVIEAISSAVEGVGANWLESRLAHLSGKFLGIVRISVDPAKTGELATALNALEAEGIQVGIEEPADTEASQEAGTSMQFSAVGPDRTGIVKEIASALSSKGINVEELETNLSSMPYSGEPIFEAQGLLSVPGSVDTKALFETLDSIANDLGIDFELEPA